MLSIRRFETISLDRIDEKNDLCKLHRRVNRPLLTESIKRHGVLNPLLVYPGGANSYGLICGFRRARSCGELGLDRAPVHILETGLDEVSRLSLALWENVPTADFGDIEKAEIVKKFLPRMDRREIISHILPLLSLNPHERDLKRCLTLADLPDPVKDFIEDGRLSVDAALKLSDFRAEAMEAVAGFVAALNFGVNKQCETVELLFEICRRENIEPGEILRDRELTAIEDNPELNRPQKSARAREVLKKRRNPLLTEAEERFNDWLRSLRLTGAVSVKHPPFFEGTTRRIEFSAKSHRELGETLNALWDLYNSGKLACLFEDDYGV